MAISIESLNKKLLPMFENKEVLEKLNTCKSPEECYEVAKDYAADISFIEFQESMTLINKYMEENKDGYLDSNDLESVAGGSDSDVIKGIGAGLVGSVIIVGGAAAAGAA